MIALLTGRVEESGADGIVLDVGGVGYLVFASARTLDRVPANGETVRLLIVTHVREDHIHLYGFLEAAERTWFRHLTTVQGVGARMALAVLSVLQPADLIQAIAAEDKAQITRADGVGPKLATRILTELKDKAGELAFARPSPALGGAAGGATSAAGAPDDGSGSVASDAVSALVNLGYQRAEAFGAVAHVCRQLGSEATVEALIRDGLKELAA